ncbi:mitochondrial outer membrane protein [Colletotrichum graminicola]|nr:mitochondrial outer membrane protein [Colletotrichum graminicola]
MPDHTSRSWFAVPAPVAALFRRFPLAVYPANDLPLRSPSRGDLPTLYVFVADDDAPRGRPSFNPSCLKWQVRRHLPPHPRSPMRRSIFQLTHLAVEPQTFLKIAGVEFRILPSTNHASPSGALPYLLPPAAPLRPVAGASRLESYALENSPLPREKRPPPPPADRLEAYQALLDTRLRTAWLYALYLAPDNATLLSRLYVRPASRNPLVRLALAHQVRSAAEAEVLKSTRAAAVDPARVYADARAAFEALAALLDENGGSGGSGGGREGRWFFGCQEPTLFDASVFAYTHLLLDGDLGWADRTLSDILAGFPGLVRHRERLLERCFPNDDDEGVLV